MSQGMSQGAQHEAQPVQAALQGAQFAQRRPGWQLPTLNVEQLQLDSFAPLEQAARRQACPKCGNSRSLLCYDCLVPFTPTPRIQLPFQLHIITHSAELLSKATGVHAAVLCPGQVHMHSLEALPQPDPARCVVMFPSDDALLPSQLPPLEQLERVIIIDSKWRKAKELNGHPSLEGMKRVKLPGSPRSSFWRFHTEGVADEGVCTIEALHLLMRALAERLPQPVGYWDNLLWYYSYQHQVVQKAAADKASKRQLQEQQGGYRKQQRRQQRAEQESGHEQLQQQPGQHQQSSQNGAQDKPQQQGSVAAADPQQRDAAGQQPQQLEESDQQTAGSTGANGSMPESSTQLAVDDKARV